MMKFQLMMKYLEISGVIICGVIYIQVSSIANLFKWCSDYSKSRNYCYLLYVYIGSVYKNLRKVVTLGTFEE